MKFVMKQISLMSRLSIAASVLLLSQQALAVGTAAGTDIDNRATVTYSVNLNPQTGIESSPTGNSTPGLNSGGDTTFVVDNRVDFSLVTQDAARVVVNPGDADAATQYLVTNVGNNVQDFLLVASNLATGTVDPFGGPDADDADMGPPDPEAYVDNGDGVWNPADDTVQYIDELMPDTSIIVWVAADADASLVNNNRAYVELEATVADGRTPGAPGAATVQDNGSTDDPTVVNVVFANSVAPGSIGDGIEEARSGYVVESASLTITKTLGVISDPFNGTANPKAIPGAVVQYSVVVGNTGTVDASDVVIADVIQTPDVALATGGYNGGSSDIEVTITGGGGGTTYCLADANAADGCTFGTPTADEFRIGLGGAIAIPAGETATILYQVTITDAGNTPLPLP